MKIHTKFPEWLFSFSTIVGAEDDPPAGTSGDQGSSENDSAGDPPKGDPDPDEDDDADDPKDTDGLKSALAKERKAAKLATKEAKATARELAALRKEKEERELAEKGETEQEKIKREKAEAKLEKLTVGFRKSAIDRAIETAAKALGFLDPEDAIAGVDRSNIEAEQDEEDPSKVSITPKTVETAVKDLAKRKPHYLKPEGTSDGEPTASRFGGGGSKQGKKDTDEVLKAKYPSLR